MSDIDKAMAFHIFQGGEILMTDGVAYLGEDASGNFPSLEAILKENGFSAYDDKPGLEIWRKEDVWFFEFDFVDTWMGVFVEGHLDYIRFVKEWALPSVQFEICKCDLPKTYS